MAGSFEEISGIVRLVLDYKCALEKVTPSNSEQYSSNSEQYFSNSEQYPIHTFFAHCDQLQYSTKNDHHTHNGD